MCGIAGILNADRRPAHFALVEEMLQRIRHRGPDGWGIRCDGEAALAHARLSIIDRAGGAQPMRDEESGLTIVFNGEIFNYLELRVALEQRGHRFRTRSDTEVILRLFAERGERSVEELNGQWAFVIWDARQRRAFASRDRLGVRPLYYTTLPDGGLAFASEIKALFAHPSVERRLDLEALEQTFTFWCPIAPRTVFENVFELPAGHSVWLSPGVRPRPFSHWSIAYDPAPDNADERQTAEQLVELLTDATRIRLRADVPVGAYVSGGLDSAVVAALVKRTSHAPLRTFSIAFEDREFDESVFQRAVVSRLGGLKRHDTMRVGQGDVARVFADVVLHAERPILRTAPAPMYLLAQRVREQGYKVVLTGEGADEMFGGYDIFKETKIRQFWSEQPDSPRRPLLLRRLYPYIGGIGAQSDEYLRSFFRIDGDDPLDPFFSHLPRWSLTSRIKTFFSEDVQAGLVKYDALSDLRGQLPAAFSGWDSFTRSQFLETAYLLPGYILSSQGDRMAMAHGVEARYPFLDHRVVGFAARLPPRLKMRGLREKYLLRRATKHLVPPAVQARPKQPYRAPDAASFLAGSPDAGYVSDLLSPERILEFGIFNPAAVTGLLAKARTKGVSGVKDNMAFVGILSTQLLVDRMIRSL